MSGTSPKLKPTASTPLYAPDSAWAGWTWRPTPGGQHLAGTLVRQAVETEDTYAAHDLLTHDACAVRMSPDAKRALCAQVHAAALGQGTLPSAGHRDLMVSVERSEAALRQALEAGTRIGAAHGDSPSAG